MPETPTWLLVGALVGLGCTDAAMPRATDVIDRAPPVLLTHAPRPDTRREDIVDELHGQRVADPYRWLEQVEQTEVRAWMEAQHQHARAELDGYPLREQLRERLRSLLYVDSISAPVVRGGRVFYYRRHADREKAVFYVREQTGGAERVLLDPNTMSDDGSVSLMGAFPSWDGKRVAYRLSVNAADAATLYVRDVETGVDLPDTIEGARYAYPSWTPDGSGFYYTALPTDPDIPVSELPGYAEIRFHALGSDARTDPLIHPATRDPQTFLSVQLSRDGRYLIVTIARGFDSTDLYFRDLADSDPSWITLSEGTPWRSSVDVHAGRFYVLSNDEAPRFRVFEVDPARPQRANWRELVAESSDTLESVEIVGGALALDYLHDASSRLELRALDGSGARSVALPGIGTASNLIGEPDDDQAYFYYSSFTESPAIYRMSVSTGQRELWHRVELPVDTSRFVVEQRWFSSRDGTRVPMFVVHRDDIVLDGSNPTLLTGYGGFSVSLTPGFSVGAVTWLEHGGVWAVANLRGGGEFGEGWHEAGKGPNKQNVFDDFIAAAEHLIATGFTRPSKLAIRGGSNGGLLVGAAMTQRPDLFAAVVCEVPLLDMIRYHLFGAGKTWISEYGSAEDPEQFRTLSGYSPYHKVRAGVAYPALLMNAADSDDRVDPMHARKFVAAVQHVSDPHAAVLLRIEKNAGHGGADLLRQSVEAGVDVYAFLLAALGVSVGRG
jgi:prolyl oligopeptidase